jgi:hypothetical protein
VVVAVEDQVLLVQQEVVLLVVQVVQHQEKVQLVLQHKETYQVFHVQVLVIMVVLLLRLMALL